MINKFSLRNFKSINTMDYISLNNLSIICGSNSSGKSSIIQAILMLAQTFGSRYFESTISLNGRLVRLGSFNDILNHTIQEKDTNADIEMSMEMSFSKGDVNSFDIKKVSLKFRFSGKKNTSKRSEDDFHPEITEGVISLERNGGTIESIHFSKKNNSDELYEVISFNCENEDEIKKNFPEYRVEGVVKKDLIPHVIQVSYDHARKLSLSFVNFLLGSTAGVKKLITPEIGELQTMEIPFAVIDKINSLIKQEYDERARSFQIPDELINIIKNDKSLNIEKIRMMLAKQSLILTPETIILPRGGEGVGVNSWRETIEKMDEKVKKALGDFLIRHREAIQGTWYSNMRKMRKTDRFYIRGLLELNHFLGYFFNKKIKYLGPLRNEPQAMYQAFDLSELDMVGLKGEYTAAVFHVNKSKKIKYPKIPSEGSNLSFTTANDTLAKACTEWLSYLGVVTEVQTYDKGKLGYELRVKTSNSDKLQDLTHVGVGVSQVLPIVVMALLSEDNDVLIFEQPELHLHPKVQSRLCDFFLAISNGNKQCIIETHSEYIINRLRRRIAQSRDGTIENKSSVLFVEKESGITVTKQININTFGAITDWPKDFFDQSDEETEIILMAATLKRYEMKNGENNR